MKKVLAVSLLALSLLSTSYAEARGSFSSGGGSRSSSYSSSRSNYASPSRGSFNSGTSSSSQRYASPSRQTTTTTTTSISRRSSNYGGGYGGGYGGYGLGYHYSNGLVTGMIIGSLMYPHHTVVYTGPGVYANNAYLLPDGRVVNNSGYQVGTYTDGQFSEIQNGDMVVQQAPNDARPPTQPQKIVVLDPTPGWVYAVWTVVAVLLIVLFFMFLI